MPFIRPMSWNSGQKPSVLRMREGPEAERRHQKLRGRGVSVTALTALFLTHVLSLSLSSLSLSPSPSLSLYSFCGQAHRHPWSRLQGWAGRTVAGQRVCCEDLVRPQRSL